MDFACSDSVLDFRDPMVAIPVIVFGYGSRGSGSISQLWFPEEAILNYFASSIFIVIQKAQQSQRVFSGNTVNTQ